MPKGQKFGGRQKGTPNKGTQDLLAICAKHKVDPFEAMIIAASKIMNPKEQVDAWEKVCQYVYPKRKALEVSADAENAGFKIIVEDYRGKS